MLHQLIDWGTLSKYKDYIHRALFDVQRNSRYQLIAIFNGFPKCCHIKCCDFHEHLLGGIL